MFDLELNTWNNSCYLYFIYQ